MRWDLADAFQKTNAMLADGNVIIMERLNELNVFEYYTYWSALQARSNEQVAELEKAKKANAENKTT